MHNGILLNVGLFCSVANSSIHSTDIIFYVNLGLLFCALVELTAIVVLRKKTSCAGAVGIVAAILVGLGMVGFFVQLGLYVAHNAAAEYVVYASMALLYVGFIAALVYCVMLSRNSHKALCIATGVLSLIPPVGAILAVKLSYTIKRDTPGQELVFNGYAYTYAALGEFCAKNGADFIDMSGEEEFAPLTRKQTKKELRALKKQANSPENIFRYAAAVAHYTPDSGKAVKLMTKAASGNYAPALFNLGYYRETGLYVKRDYKKAADFYRRAASAGDDDAEMRLCILAIKTGNEQKGLQMLRDRAKNKSDLCALYNIGICAENGIGGAPDVLNAVDIYNECADRGLFIAQKRIFAMASKDINSASNGDFFRKVTDRRFSGTFAVMINGLIEIKKRHAADAARYFLTAVKHRDRWEGFARVLVGTLYLDRGKSFADRVNGAEFVRSAVGMHPCAKNVYAVIPSQIRKCVQNTPEPQDSVVELQNTAYNEV